MYSSHSACHVYHHILRGWDQALFLSLQWLSVVQLVFLRGWRGASSDGVTADWLGSVHPVEVHIARGPQTKLRHIFSLQSINAEKIAAELSLSSGLLSGRVVSNFPLLLIKPIPHPWARKTGARVNTEWMENFPFFFMFLSILAINGCLCTLPVGILCPPEKASRLKPDMRPVHKSLLPHDLDSWVFIARHFPVVCHSLQWR